MSCQIVQKLWGHEKIIVNNDLYCGKIIVIEKNKIGSFHYHKIKDETFYLLSGKVKLKYSNSDDFDSCEELIMEPGSSFRLFPRTRHQIIGLEDSEIIEFSTKDMVEDSYRVISSEHFIGGYNG